MKTDEGVRGEIERIVRYALAEDVGDGDRTTEWTVPPGATGRADVVARAAGTISGVEFADQVFEAVDPHLERTWSIGEGGTVGSDETLVTLAGSLASILIAERTALNGLARLSGIASATSEFVEAVEGTDATIVDTRKTTPGWRHLEKQATRAGGAINHRLGLYDMVLIKENHVRAAGGVSPALKTARAKAEREGLQVEIEVTTLAELDQVLTQPPDRILLDNMTVDDLRAAVTRVASSEGPRPLLEASGGVRLDTVRAIAETGVDLVSVGAITHSAPAMDLSLLVVS